MSRGLFLLFTTAGSAIWNVALITGGRVLGGQLDNAERVIGWLTIAAMVVLVIWYAWRVTRWNR